MMNHYRPPALQEAIDALGQVYRALKAWNFYPHGHPQRAAGIAAAHQALLDVLGGSDLSLVCGRNSFALPDGEALRDSTRLCASLSYELFIRRAHKITFLSDLSRGDLFAFIRLLSGNPDSLAAAGGLEARMADLGIRTIWLNEFSLSVINRKRREIEQGGVFPEGPDEGASDGGAGAPFAPILTAVSPDPEHELQTLIGRLTAATAPDSYLLLVRQALGCADHLAARRQFASLASLAELLAGHADERSHRAVYALFGVEHLASVPGLTAYLLEHADSPHGVSRDALAHLVACAGETAVTAAVETIGATDRLALRKALALMLVRVGGPAVAALLTMMDDRRWYVIRAVASILGTIGSRDGVFRLAGALRHSDIRVCKEAIRSLAKIGGPEAEQALIGLLRGSDARLLPQVITSLGGMKSRAALPELLRIVCAGDLFLNDLPVRIRAVEAMGLIGDRQVVPYLAEQLASRRLIDRKRRYKLKTAIAVCLGQLADPRALAALHGNSRAPGDLGVACRQAAESIVRNGGTPDGAAA